jgi:hypothetical protein
MDNCFPLGSNKSVPEFPVGKNWSKFKSWLVSLGCEFGLNILRSSAPSRTSKELCCSSQTRTPLRVVSILGSTLSPTALAISRSTLEQIWSSFPPEPRKQSSLFCLDIGRHIHAKIEFFLDQCHQKKPGEMRHQPNQSHQYPIKQQLDLSRQILIFDWEAARLHWSEWNPGSLGKVLWCTKATLETVSQDTLENKSYLY